MRSTFAGITPAISQDQEAARCHAYVLLYGMGGWYKAIWPDTQLTFSVFYEVIHETVGRRGWWKTPPPRLLESSKNEAAEIAATVRESLLMFRQRGDNRNYSLATKWLHFCFPETFAIYDSYACKSIRSAVTLADLGASTQSLDIEQLYLDMMNNKSGEGYIGLSNFYRAFGTTARAHGLDGELRAAAEANQGLLTTEPGCSSARVSMLDIVDKLLWKANGSPTALGVR